jgi:predicted TPR repeat methyltransferase
MVAEARARKIYEELDAEEIESWLSRHPTSGSSASASRGGAGDVSMGVGVGGAQPTGHFDLVVSADVLVYIGPLEGIFQKTAASMVPSQPGSGRAPSLFVFSTEALGSEDEIVPLSRGPGYALSPTGRCVHARTYILGLAATNGFELCKVTRQPIRKNAGADVIGDLFVLEYVGA